MIRVNLLEGTAEHRVAVQKTKVAARRGQQIFMVASALGLCLLCLGVDHLWTSNAHSSAKSELEREQKIADSLKADVERKAQLENEIKEVEDRSKIIKDLRAAQETPVPMLSAINARMPGANNDFHIDLIKQVAAQKDAPAKLHIVGFSYDQSVIGAFSQRMEESESIFTNLSLSIERMKEKESGKKTSKNAEEEPEDDVPSRFKFTIDSVYNKPGKSN